MGPDGVGADTPRLLHRRRRDHPDPSSVWSPLAVAPGTMRRIPATARARALLRTPPKNSRSRGEDRRLTEGRERVGAGVHTHAAAASAPPARPIPSRPHPAPMAPPLNPPRGRPRRLVSLHHLPPCPSATPMARRRTHVRNDD